MKKPASSRRTSPPATAPGRAHWWWRAAHLKRAVVANRQLDHYFHWKVPGRKHPAGGKWTAAQRRNIETALGLYELDARISKKYLFGQPAHLLEPERLASVIEFAQIAGATSRPTAGGEKRQPFSWAWIEYLDKRNDPKAPRLTRRELDGVIAGMKYCLEYFLHR